MTSNHSNSQTPLNHDPVLNHLLGPIQGTTLHEQFLQVDNSKYTHNHEIRIITGSFNVHGNLPEAQDRLHNWLKFPQDAWPTREGDGDNDKGPDIVILGFQEVVELSANNVIIGAGGNVVQLWDYFIDQELNEKKWLGFDEAKDPVLVAMNEKWMGGRDETEGKVHHVASASLDAAIGIGDFEETTTEAIEDVKNQKYVKIASKQMVGVYLTVWAKSSIVDKIRGIQMVTIATGVFGYLGNKGAVAIRMRVYDSSFLLLACHLPSGQSSSDLLKRNVDFAEITRRCQFPQPESEEKDVGQWMGISTIDQHDHVIWMGDFNYRINMDDDELRQALSVERFDRLLAKDELLYEMDKGTVINNYTEAILSFPPTYKYRKRSNMYLGQGYVPDLDELEDESEEMASSKEKVRRPAWTDRILFKSKGGLHQLQYGCGDLDLSDHRPVYAVFLLMAKEYVRTLLNETIDMARKARDAKEMAAVPTCTLEPRDGMLHLEIVQYNEQLVKEVFLTNTGSVPAMYKFIPIPGAEDVAPLWLEISPHSSLLEPETTHKVNLKILVTGGESGSAQDVVENYQGKLETILVLRVEGGRDFFISLVGQYQPSFFGLSFDTVMQLSKQTSKGEALVQITPSVTELNSQLDYILHEPPMKEREDVLECVPVQIKQIMVYLSQSDRLQTPGILIDSIQICNTQELGGVDGSETEAVRKVRNALDNHLLLEEAIGDNQTHVVAAVLLLIFRALPRSFMPHAASQMCNVMVPAPQEAANLLAAEMTKVEWGVLRHMLNLIRKILAHSLVNGVNAKSISQMLSTIWFPPLADPFNDTGQTEGIVFGDSIQERLVINETVTQTRSDFILQFIFPQRRQGGSQGS